MCGNFRNCSTGNFAHYHGVKLQRGKQLLIALIILHFQLFVRSWFRVAKLSVYSEFSGVICHPENGRRITSTSFNPLIFLILFLFSICLIKLPVTSPFLKFHVRESKTVLDGFHAMNSRFQVPNSLSVELRNGPDNNDSNNGNEHVGMQKRC